jgi:IMP dehydrogenase
MKFLTKEKALSFDDVILVPNYSDIVSRSEIDTSSIMTFNNQSLKFKIPIISSPMSTVTESHMCNAISSQGGLGILHRYNTIDHQAKLLSFVNEESPRSAAIGVSGDYKERLAALYEKGLKVVCIDIAHGDHKLMENTVEFIRSNYNDLIVIAGNIATGHAYKRLYKAGAHGVRTSVGSGSICTTRIQTGHGMPTFQAILDCVKAKKELLNNGNNLNELPFIIADGGIKNSGDIVKSLAAGADFVMLGSMLSGTKETPGKVIKDSKGRKIKSYNGMASKIAQKNWKGSYSSIEGIGSYVLYKGTVSKVINEIMSNVRSGMSYSGARNILELQEESIAIIQTSSSHVEGNPHILNGRK